MVTILPRHEGFGAAFAKALGGAAGEVGQGYFEGKRQKEQLESENKAAEEMGIHLRGFKDPELRKTILKEGVKKKQEKEANKYQALQGLDQSIDEMLSLADSPGIGLMGQFNPTSDAFYNRGRLQTLKGELLNYYKSLFPRGLTQQEFKKLEKDYLPSNNDTREGMKGKLDEFKKLIHRKLEQQGVEESGSSEKEVEKKAQGKIKFNPNNPEHKAKRDQLMKRFKNDREKVAEVLDREFE